MSLRTVGIEFELKGQREVVQGLKNVAKAQEALTRGIRVSVDASNSNARSLDRIAREALKAQREMDRLAKALSQGRIASSQFHAETNKIATRLRSMGMDRAQSEVTRYKNALLQASQGQRMLATATVAGTQRSDAFEAQTRQTTNALNEQAAANQFAGRRMNAMGMATQQVGYQVGDFLVQVQSGTNAFVAFGQQATQLVGILPLMADSLNVSTGRMILISSVLGILIPLMTAFGAALARTGGAGEIFSELAYALEPIRPLLDALAVAMSTVAEVTINTVNLLVNNLDRLVVMATVVAAFFAAKWVAAFVAAGGVTAALTGALGLLRIAMLRLPFVGLVVVATEIVYQFSRLANAAGGLGEAMSMVGAVIVELWQRAGVATRAAGAVFSEVFNSMKANAASAVQETLTSIVGLANTIANAFEGAFLAVQAIWQALPNVFARVGAMAMNALIGAMQQGLTALVGVMNDVLTLGGLAPEMAIPAPDLSGWQVTVPEAANIGVAISDAFNSAFDDNPLQVPDIGLQGIIDRSLEDADFYRGVAADLAEQLNMPLEALNELRQAMISANEEGRNIDVREWFGGLSDEDAGGGTGGGATDEASSALEDMQRQFESLAETIKSSMSDAFMSIVDGTKTAAEAFRDMARNILKQLFDILVVQRIVGSFDSQTGTGTGLVGGIMRIFGSANGNAFQSGNVIPFEKGSALYSGNVIPFANGGVVSSPTMFPMRGNQTGLMGEAGPEAIMPLKRGRDGKLGVQAEGGGGNVVVNNHFHFQANGDESVKRIIAQEAPKIANLTQQQIIDQRKRGGVMKATF